MLCINLRFAPLRVRHTQSAVGESDVSYKPEPCTTSPNPLEADLIADAAEYRAFGFPWDDISGWLDIPRRQPTPPDRHPPRPLSLAPRGGTRPRSLRAFL